MRVGWVIPCRYVEVHENLATIVGGGIEQVWVPALPPPAPVQILCAVRIVASRDEVAAELPDEPEDQLISRVYGPAMGLISELAQPFALSGTWDPTIEPAALIPLGVVFAPEEEGQHTIEIAVNERGFSFPMTVTVAEPGP